MAGQNDTTISIGLKADLTGGVQTEQQLERIRKKAVEVGRDTSSASEKAAGAIGNVKSAAGALRNILSGFGVAAVFNQLVSALDKLRSRFASAKADAESLKREIKADAQAAEVRKLSEEYDRLTKSIEATSRAGARRLDLIEREVAARRELFDAKLEAAMEDELAAIDSDDPAAAERREEIAARYGAKRKYAAAENDLNDIVLKIQRLNSEAAKAESDAKAKTASADADDRKIRELRGQLQDATTNSFSKNNADTTSNIGKVFSNAGNIIRFSWGKVGEYDTEEGNRIRAEWAEEVRRLESLIEKLETSRDKKLEDAGRLMENAAAKRKDVATERSRIMSAKLRMETAEKQGARERAEASAALSSREDQVAADRDTVAGADARRAEIQARIDAENARLKAAEDRANKEDQDAYLARRALEQGDAENRGKGWNRYVQGSRKDLEASVRREEAEAAEAKAEFGRTKESVRETVRMLLDEMRKFNSDLERAKSRLGVKADNGEGK